MIIYIISVNVFSQEVVICLLIDFMEVWYIAQFVGGQ